MPLESRLFTRLANPAASAYPDADFRTRPEGRVAKSKIIVALRDEESVESLVTLACQLTSGMDAELIALHVIEVPLATPLEAEGVVDQQGEKVLASAQEVAKRLTRRIVMHSLRARAGGKILASAQKGAGRFARKITTRLLKARNVGEAITGEAKDQHADLLIVGHRKPHPHPLGELLLGSTVQYVAHHAPCRVLIQIPPPQ
jgi:nucleotide-binding universal stress UspA family protein